MQPHPRGAITTAGAHRWGADEMRLRRQDSSPSPRCRGYLAFGFTLANLSTGAGTIPSPSLQCPSQRQSQPSGSIQPLRGRAACSQVKENTARLEKLPEVGWLVSVVMNRKAHFLSVEILRQETLGQGPLPWAVP